MGWSAMVSDLELSMSINLHLPYKLEFSSILDARNGIPCNITTGTDANGDGNFNDRPSYASAPVTGVYSTRFGQLTKNAVNGNVPHNLGTIPTGIELLLSCPIALLGGHLIRSQLFGIGTADPAVILFAAFTLSIAALIATYLPARRAASIDPMQALRSE
jgi:hypothetical protein